LVIEQSAKDINFNYSMNFEIMTTVSDHTMLSLKNPCDIHLKHVISGELGLPQPQSYFDDITNIP